MIAIRKVSNNTYLGIIHVFASTLTHYRKFHPSINNVFEDLGIQIQIAFSMIKKSFNG